MESDILRCCLKLITTGTASGFLCLSGQRGQFNR
jgi:hypothetical protein